MAIKVKIGRWKFINRATNERVFEPLPYDPKDVEFVGLGLDYDDECGSIVSYTAIIVWDNVDKRIRLYHPDRVMFETKPDFPVPDMAGGKR